MERLICVIVLAAASPALAADPAPRAATPDGFKAFEATLAPGKVHEECQRIEAGDKRRYMWKSDAPVDFNIHFHRGNDVTYPVKRDAMRGDGGTFAAKAGEDYCWMWTAKAAPARIEGRIEVR